jgi:hypothetical protein
MANEEMEMAAAWNESKSMLLDRAIGLNGDDRGAIPSIYANAWKSARKSRFAFSAAKVRGEIAVKAFIAAREPKITLSI